MDILTFTEIRYNTTIPSLPVQCTYTSHILRQEHKVIVSSAGGTDSRYELYPYPSPYPGRQLTPYAIRYITTVLNESLTVYSYNLSAEYGYRLVLQLNFTELNQRVFAVSDLNAVFTIKVVAFTIEGLQLDLGSVYCPYTSSQASCGTTWIDGQELDHTCVLYAAGDNGTYARCNSGSHCYSTLIDRCDGFIDWEDETDETGCSTPRKSIK